MNEEMFENEAPDNVPEAETQDTGVENQDGDDYAALIERDLEALRSGIPELQSISDISELENPVRYGALRDLGLTPEEAYRATTTRAKRQAPDNRAHLRSSVPKASFSPASSMSYRDLEMARELFSGVSDAEIQRLYRKVTR